MPNTSTGEASATQQLQDTKAALNDFGLLLPTFIPRRYKPKNIDSWSGHLAFASELIQAIRPEIIVELGTHFGEAYFTFCQTVDEHRLGSLCYAVDHWMGDEHAGHYGEEVFENVRTYNERFYRQFSYLLRMSFDEALPQFADNSIGLLHVDGFHTYEAARHDFRTWLPKVKEGGIILLHDICPKHQDFGVWQLWDEIKAEFPNTFEFHHAWGLGVVQKGHRNDDAALLKFLFSGSAAIAEEVRRRYVIYASHLENLLESTDPPSSKTAAQPAPSEVRVQVFPFGATGYSEDTGVLRIMKAGVWDTLEFELPQGAGNGPLRVDPSHEPGLVQIREMALFSQSTGAIVWSTADSGAHNVSVQGTGALLPCDEGLLVSSTGDDPQLLLPSLAGPQGALRFRIQLRVLPAPLPAPEVIAGLIEQMHGAVDDEKRRASDETRRTAEELQRLQIGIDQEKASLRATEDSLKTTQAKLRDEQNVRNSIEQSLSWRLTAPVRNLMTKLRSGPRRTS